MNSLLGNIGQALFNGSNKVNPVQSQNNSPNIFLQALGAAMRGESPQQFMQNLAMTHPQLKQYDLSNLQQTAQQICQQKGVDAQQVMGQIDNIVSSTIQGQK